MPARWLVVVGGEVDGLDGGAEQVLAVQRRWPRKLAQGTGRRAALWLNGFGITDLVVAGTLGALTGYQLLNVTPSAAPISELPLALVPTVTVPLPLALHVTSIITLARTPRPAPSAAGPLIPGVASA